MQYETVEIRIDESTIAADDQWKIIEPVWWSANIYEGPDQYEQSLLPFSRPQRFVFAVTWYRAEVNNGGHLQFYSNSTGIVWKDALEAFWTLDLPEHAMILAESAERLGGSPSLDRDTREEQLEDIDPDFDDLDDRFYAAEKKGELDTQILSFIRAHRSDFYFQGTIRRGLMNT